MKVMQTLMLALPLLTTVLVLPAMILMTAATTKANTIQHAVNQSASTPTPAPPITGSTRFPPLLPRLTVSDNGHFLVTAQGDPFFWLADTAWELFGRLDQAEADRYLEDRRQKGFNVVQVVILTEYSTFVPNKYGQMPLLGEDPLQLNEDYLLFVDWFINRAAEHGIYVALLPTWGDKVTVKNGLGPEIFTTTNARPFGAILGARYRDATNVIWMLGGDRNPENNTDIKIWREMAAGVEQAAGVEALITYHPRGASTSSKWFHEDDVFDFNTLQSGHSTRDIPAWEWIAADYDRAPIKPVLDAEMNYEDYPVNREPEKYGFFDDYDVRKQAYRTVFAGGFGITYGNHAIWQFASPDRKMVTNPEFYWYEALDRPGSQQLTHLARLMLSRPYLTRIPDQSLLPESVDERDAEHMRATRADDGSYALIYTPVLQPINVNLSLLSGDVIRAWWFDPRTGSAIIIGDSPKTESATFIPPPTREDWVLVLDDAAQNFPAPGLGSVYRHINLNGKSLVIAGETWESGSTVANLSIEGAGRFCDNDVPLTPPTDLVTATMLHCSVFGTKESTLTLSGIPNGDYQVAVYNWEDNNAETFDLLLQNQTVLTEYNSGSAGTWARLGPWNVTVTDGTLSIVASGGHANLSGIEIRLQRTSNALNTAVPFVPPA